MEIWKNIKGYEGLYQVSNLGNVRRIKFINNIIEKEKITYLKPNKCNRYSYIVLCKNGKPKRFSIHRLVAENFLDKSKFKSLSSENRKNIKNLQVNHKDENKFNNNLDNLEWCTILYNMNYGNVRKKISISHRKENLKKRKPVIQYDINMNYIKEYNGICEAVKETKINRISIIRVCKNKQKTAGGYIWKYKNLKETRNNGK